MWLMSCHLAAAMEGLWGWAKEVFRHYTKAFGHFGLRNDGPTKVLGLGKFLWH